MHRTEVLANFTEVMKALCRTVSNGELTRLLLLPPRDERQGRKAQKRLSPAEIDKLVADYRDGEGSIYVLASHYGIHRQTVAGHLKSRGLELGRRPMNGDELSRAQQLQQQGLSLNAIGRALGRDPKTIKASLFDRL